MSSDAQIKANQANSKHSTGPRTDSGKAASSQNNFKFGFCGNFKVLETEDQGEFDAFLELLREEHQPATLTENLLVEKMAQHYWLSQRAQGLQDNFLSENLTAVELSRYLGLFLRYQTTHDRAFHKSLSQLLKLRAERRKLERDEAALSQRAEDSKKAFESQKRKEAEEARKQEAHEAKVRLANSKAAWNELNTDIKGTIQAPFPGYAQIPFEVLKPVISSAIADVAKNPELLAALKDAA